MGSGAAVGPRRPQVGRDDRAVDASRGRTDRRLAAQADGADSDRRALADSLLVRTDARLGTHDGREDTGVAARVTHARLLRERSRLPDGVRAVRRGFPVTLSGGSRLDAARAATGGVRPLGARAPAVDPDRRTK